MSQTTEYNLTPFIQEQIVELAKKLTDEERAVILHQGTEHPSCGSLLNNKEHGIYTCKLCSLPLFRTGDKFESGTGWPSFTEPVDEKHVKQIVDQAHGMTRTEIRCTRAPRTRLPRRPAADRKPLLHESCVVGFRAGR